jgi:hypothetical protein
MPFWFLLGIAAGGLLFCLVVWWVGWCVGLLACYLRSLIAEPDRDRSRLVRRLLAGENGGWIGGGRADDRD